MLVTSLFTSPPLPHQPYTIGETTFKMIELPAAKGFWMGSHDDDEVAFSQEKPRHQRDISAFSLAEFPVTQQLWQEVVARAQVQGLFNEQALLKTSAGTMLRNSAGY